MSSFFAQIMEPGGGVMLLPFVRLIVYCLLLLCLTAAFLDVARVHMVILCVLSAGLLLSLSFFESEFKKARGYSNSNNNNNQSNGAGTAASARPTAASNKTD